MMKQNQLLTVFSLTAGYHDEDILKDISFQVAAGEFVSIVAPNGTGKSTLLKCITGVLPLRAGEIQLHGRSVRTYAPREFARQVAVVGEEDSAFAYTTEQIVTMGRFPHIPRFAQPSSVDRALVQEAMDSVGIWHKRRSTMQELSQGERQKVMIARALAQAPKLLLLDEPTSHLDIANQYSVLGLVKRLASERNIAVIAVLHDINLALRFSSRMILLKQGRLLADGPPKTVLTPDMLQALYEIKFTLLRQGDICCVQPESAEVN